MTTGASYSQEAAIDKIGSSAPLDHLTGKALRAHWISPDTKRALCLARGRGATHSASRQRRHYYYRSCRKDAHFNLPHRLLGQKTFPVRALPRRKVASSTSEPGFGSGAAIPVLRECGPALMARMQSVSVSALSPPEIRPPPSPVALRAPPGRHRSPRRRSRAAKAAL